jgi:hypothetical protein
MEKKGIIYEIVCNDTGERYIGSTTSKYLSSRIAHHRHQQSTCCSKQIINRNNYCYNILETIIINDIKELRIKEREYYDKLECINVRPPYCSSQEIKEYNKNYDKSRKDIMKEYYEINKEKIKARRKERWILLKK